MQVNGFLAQLAHLARRVLALQRGQIDHAQRQSQRLHFGLFLDAAFAESCDPFLDAGLVDARDEIEPGQGGAQGAGWLTHESSAALQFPASAVSRASSIISPKLVWRSSLLSASPLRMSSLTVQMASASTPCSAASA